MKGKEFLIGDPHFYDDNIRLYERPKFTTVKSMNYFMIDNWNRVVDKNDTVYVVGDFFAQNCTEDDIIRIVNALNGHIILIVGNHDVPLLGILRKYMDVIEYPIVKDGFWIISHEPMYVSENAPYANVFAHVHNNPMYKDVSSRSFCVSAERINYTPMLLEDVKKAVVGCQTIDTPWNLEDINRMFEETKEKYVNKN